MEKKKCLNCGEELIGRQKKYCSKECGSKYYRQNNEEELKEYNKKYWKNNKNRMSGRKEKYREDNREKSRVYSERYNKQNREELILYKREHYDKDKAREYYQKNKEKLDKYYQDNKEKILKNEKKRYQDNRDERLQYQKNYRQDNKEKIKEKERKSRIKNKDRLSEQKKTLYEKKYKMDPMYKLNKSMSSGICYFLKSKDLSKNGEHYENLIINTIEEIKEHLEKNFLPGMSWKNYGKKWHIDHIIPKSFFKFSSTDDPEFKYCWSINNLQPLWELDNIKKGDKMILWGKKVNARYIDRDYFSKL